MVKPSTFQALTIRVNTLERLIRDMNRGNNYSGSGKEDGGNGGNLITCKCTENINIYEAVLIHTNTVAGEIPKVSLYTAAQLAAQSSIVVYGIAASYGVTDGEILIQTDGKHYAYIDNTANTIVTGSPLVPNDSSHLELGTAANVKFYALEDPDDDDEIVLVQFALGGGASTGAVPVKITSSVDYNDYKCDVYGDGPDSAATASTQNLRILQIAATETVPTNTWLLATKIGDDYFGQVPVWM